MRVKDGVVEGDNPSVRVGGTDSDMVKSFVKEEVAVGGGSCVIVGFTVPDGVSTEGVALNEAVCVALPVAVGDSVTEGELVVVVESDEVADPLHVSVGDSDALALGSELGLREMVGVSERLDVVDRLVVSVPDAVGVFLDRERVGLTVKVELRDAVVDTESVADADREVV